MIAGEKWCGYVDVWVCEHIYDEPIRTVNTTTFSCWDFENTPYYIWLVNNATDTWDWDLYGVEDDQNRIPCRVYFSSLSDLMAFKLTWSGEQ